MALHAHPVDADATRTASVTEALAAAPRTDCQLHNYDDRPYTVVLVARDDDGVAFERRYDLEPGESRAERGTISPGEYDVCATVIADECDAAPVDKRDSVTCHVGTDPAETVRVELGNHVVTVSEGVY
jgi:hypothetical protein